MARPFRLEFPGSISHVTTRGNARQAIVLDDEDRALFLACLGDVGLRLPGLSRHARQSPERASEETSFPH